MLSEDFVQELRRFLGKGKVLDQMLNNVMKTGDINVQDRSGNSPLIWASYICNEEMVEFLLRNGANPNLCDSENVTALGWSTKFGNINITELLLEYGADVNVQDNYGHTPLMNSSFKGNVSLVKMLLKNGADVNAQDKRGYTPLMSSLFIIKVSLIKLLLKNGADVNIKDYYGLTALDHAIQRGYRNIEDILRNPDKYISEFSREVECVSRLEEFKKIRKRVFR